MRGTPAGHRRGLSFAIVTAVAALALGVFAVSALAHVERTAYWPNPAPDTSVSPPAGGAVPKMRSLASALPPRKVTVRRRRPGRRVAPVFTARARGAAKSTVRIVCQPGSLARAKQEINKARTVGFRDRPTEPLRKLTAKQAARWIDWNKRFFAACHYSEIQPAVTASHNNDRVIIMPGVYTEPTSRKQPAFPPQCDQYRVTSEKGKGAVSYAYQVHCPNAQNLVAVIGRADTGKPDPPSSATGRPDPHGLPNAGPCIRCNLQMEGTGPSPDDTVIDAGRPQSGDGAPIGSAKDVAIKADRADGFVLRDVTVRHAAEHDVYVLETDGYRLERNRYMYAGEYGTLTFTSDHGLTHICEAAGSGDSGVYPGGAPDTGVQRDASFYPQRRLNQEITLCDSHHNNLGYSGTMGNATHVVKNNFYDNTTGLATDSFYAGGHPGFPQDSSVYENNNFYSNNFNIYGPKSDVTSRTPVPIGVGIMIAGGNNDEVRNNHIWDNWRRGTMLLSVPDAIACAPNSQGIPPCTPQGAATTSNFDVYHDNVMSRTPAGQQSPNGVDFWWDEFPSNHDNCWGPNNIGAGGTPASITSDPPRAPGDATLTGFLPVKDCGSPLNVGRGNSQKESVLVACAEEVEGTSNNQHYCDWYVPPAKPGSPAAKQQAADQQGIATQLSASGFPQLPQMCTLIGGDGGTLTCSPFAHRLGG